MWVPDLDFGIGDCICGLLLVAVPMVVIGAYFRYIVKYAIIEPNKKYKYPQEKK